MTQDIGLRPLLQSLALAALLFVLPAASHSAGSNDPIAFAALPPGTFTVLDNSPTSTSPQDINDRGEVVGFYEAEGRQYGFFHKEGFFFDFTEPSGSNTYPFGMNNNRELVGTYGDVSDSQAFLRAKDGFSDIHHPLEFVPTLTTPSAINNRGKVVGYFVDSSLIYQGFYLSDGLFTTIAYPAAATLPLAINDAGSIVGAYGMGDSRMHGFIFTDGAFSTVDHPNTTQQTFLTGIAYRDQIVGCYVTDNISHPFFYHKGAFAAINIPGAQPSVYNCPTGINKRGQIVGQYWDGTKILGFLFTPNARFTAE